MIEITKKKIPQHNFDEYYNQPEKETTLKNKNVFEAMAVKLKSHNYALNILTAVPRGGGEWYELSPYGWQCSTTWHSCPGNSTLHARIIR